MTRRRSNNDFAFHAAALHEQELQAVRRPVRPLVRSQTAQQLRHATHTRSNWSRWRMCDFFRGNLYGQHCMLFIIAVCLLFMGTFCFMLTEGNDMFDTTFYNAFWFSWGMFFDPGTQSALASDEDWEIKFVAVTFSVLGLVFNMALLGLVVDRIRFKIERWRKLYYRLVRNNHTIILGYTDKTLFLLNELTRELDPPSCIVILAPVEKYEVLSEIYRYLPASARHNTELLVFAGDPQEFEDLERVSCASAKNIFILGGQGKPRASDMSVVASTLSLSAIHPTPCNGTIVAELRIAHNIKVVETLGESMSVRGVMTKDGINRVLCITAGCRFLGDIFMELICNADGDRLQVIPAPATVIGGSFGDAFLCFPDAVLIGVEGSDGRQSLSPENAYIIRACDSLFVVTGEHTRATPRPPAACLLPRHQLQLPEMTAKELDDANLKMMLQDSSTICVVGLPVDTVDLIEMLDMYLPTASTVFILSNNSLSRRKRQFQEGGVGLHGEGLSNIKIVHLIGPTTSKRHLNRLPLAQAHSVIVLSDDVDEDEEVVLADAASLSTMLLLCDLMDELEISERVTVLTELLDARTLRTLNKSERKNQQNGTSLKSEGTKPNLLQQSDGAHPHTHTPTNPATNPRAHTATQPDQNSFHWPKRVVPFHSNMLETGLFHISCKHTRVFNCLMTFLGPGGLDVVLAPVSAYITAEQMAAVGERMTFWDMGQRVRQRKEVLLGYVTQNNTVVINPRDKQKSRWWWPYTCRWCHHGSARKSGLGPCSQCAPTSASASEEPALVDRFAFHFPHADHVRALVVIRHNRKQIPGPRRSLVFTTGTFDPLKPIEEDRSDASSGSEARSDSE